jgi:hypothetical protein
VKGNEIYPSLTGASNMKKIHEQAEETNQRRWDEIAPIHEKSYKSIKVLRNGGARP